MCHKIQKNIWKEILNYFWGLGLQGEEFWDRYKFIVCF